jgi:hypothetical protein
MAVSSAQSGIFRVVHIINLTRRSAFHDTPVALDILRNHTNDGTVFQRSVVLKLLPITPVCHGDGVAYCVASSRVSITNPAYLAYFLAEKPGLGQFFWHFHLSPAFELVEVGRHWSWASMTTTTVCDRDNQVAVDGERLGMDESIRLRYAQVTADWPDSIWRLYRLHVDGIDCLIFEVMRADVLDERLLLNKL